MWTLRESTRRNWEFFSAICTDNSLQKRRGTCLPQRNNLLFKKINKSKDGWNFAFRQTPTQIQVHSLANVGEITRVRLPEAVLWMLDFGLPPLSTQAFSFRWSVFLPTSSIITCLPSDFSHSVPLPGTTSLPELWTHPGSPEMSFQHENSVECVCFSTRDPILGPLVDFEFGVRNLWLKYRNLYNTS